MTKELEAFEEIKKYLVNLKFHFLEEELSIVETALKNEDKEKFDLIKQVRELKDENASLKSFNSKLWIERQDNEKQLKALEIIKEILDIEFIERIDLDNAMYYAVVVRPKGYEPFGMVKKIGSKEEYDLLKEVLL